ncbi:MAG: hypothetical protein ACE5KM_00120 [Planctomycetaceae bacterium]
MGWSDIQVEVIDEDQGCSGTTVEGRPGFTSQHELLRPVLRYEQMADYDQMVHRIEELRGQGKTFARIAEHLNAEGFRPLKQAKTFHKDIVNRLFNKICQERPAALRIAERQDLQDHE